MQIHSMQCRRGGGKPYKAPKVFPPPLPHPPHPLSFSPQRLSREYENEKTVLPSFLRAGRLGEVERGWRGCGGGGRKTLGPYMVFPRPSCIAFVLKENTQRMPASSPTIDSHTSFNSPALEANQTRFASDFDTPPCLSTCFSA